MWAGYALLALITTVALAAQWPTGASDEYSALTSTYQEETQEMLYTLDIKIGQSSKDYYLYQTTNGVTTR